MQELKRCSKCGTEHPATTEFFARHKYSKGGLRSWCRPCHRAEQRAYRAKNLEQENARARQWAKDNPERRREYQRQWEDENRDKLRENWRRRYHADDTIKNAHKEWTRRNPERRRAISRRYNRKSRQNPATRLNDRIRAGIAHSLASAGTSKGGRKWELLVGYALQDLTAHIERQFVRGMSWDNMGDWHIDHIVPLSSFSFETAEDEGFRAAWALTNLRPLWNRENWSKGGKRLHLL